MSSKMLTSIYAKTLCLSLLRSKQQACEGQTIAVGLWQEAEAEEARTNVIRDAGRLATIVTGLLAPRHIHMQLVRRPLVVLRKIGPLQDR